MSIAHLLNTTADMKRPTTDFDGYGTVKYTLATFSAAHPCRISAGVPAEITAGPKEYAEANAVVYVGPETTFKRDDEVHHTDATYTVLGVQKPSVPQTYTALICKVVQDGE